MTVHLGPLLVEAADPAGARVLADYSPERFTLADVEDNWRRGGLRCSGWRSVRGRTARSGGSGAWRPGELVRAGASAEGDDLLVDPGGNEVSAPGRAKPKG